MEISISCLRILCFHPRIVSVTILVVILRDETRNKITKKLSYYHKTKISPALPLVRVNTLPLRTIDCEPNALQRLISSDLMATMTTLRITELE